jgi:hypothetical protein
LRHPTFTLRRKYSAHIDYALYVACFAIVASYHWVENFIILEVKLFELLGDWRTDY